MKATPPKLLKFSAAKQRNMDELLDKNSERTITAKEKLKLERLVAEAERLMVANAKRLASFSQGQSKQGPASATPVTVWLQSSNAGR